MIPEGIKKTIDTMSYYQLLEKVRFAPAGDPFFIGEVGEYFLKRTEELRAADPGGAVADSKALGWSRM